MFGFKKKNNKQSEIKVDESLRHVAFIMDGNGRWAKKRGMPREYGHKKGAETMKNIVRYCGSIGINCVTVYAFSTENWKRPEKEVNAIMELLGQYIDYLYTVMDKDDIQVHFLGDKGRFPAELKERLEKAEKDSASHHKILNVALNYGGRDEIVHAVNRLIAQGKTEVTEHDIEENLYTAHCPPPDLIVRTAGEIRTSNFLMWQGAYSELYFTDVLWPEFSESDVDLAVKEFYKRTRRFGAVV
ncbi:MAG: di-trans,poly-cis-decaprenylcistransferase [Clostridia bacterium]|nr:di-trans,poly-cis-decaprenylcistransferase [Clostridia bacterium]